MSTGIALQPTFRHAVHQDSELVPRTGGDVLCVSQAVPPIRGQLSTAVWARFSGVIICSIPPEEGTTKGSFHQDIVTAQALLPGWTGSAQTMSIPRSGGWVGWCARRSLEV